MPHPFYAPLHWVCVVNLADRTKDQLPNLMEGAHEQAKRLSDNQRPG